MLTNLLKQTVNTQRNTPTQGATSGEVPSWTTIYTALACSIQPINLQWQVLYAQKKSEVSNTIFFAGNPDIQLKDQIIYGARTFLVKGVRNLVELSRVTAIDCWELL